MAIVEADWEITRSSGNIRYIGNDHTGVNPSYATVIEFHRFLQDKADDALASGDDELDITNTNPSQRSTDNIITLINGYNIDATAAEHLYDGSIIQTGGDVFYDGFVNFGNAGILIQLQQDGAVLSDDWWNYSVGGTHTGAADQTLTLTDSALNTALTNRGLTTDDDLAGYFLFNTTDGSFGLIESNDYSAGTITLTAAGLSGGTDNDFDNGDAYTIARGLNPDDNAGVSHRFMLQTRTGGTDVDGRRVLGQSRRWGFSFAEFRVNGTARGNNVLALSDASDLNNTTAFDTVSGWTTIVQATTGYVLLDVNDDASDEEYYVEWNRDTFSINQFYERMKYISADGTSETQFGISGELFRGITHEIPYTGLTGTFDEGNEITWTGTNSGSGQVLADDGTATVWIQLLSGVAPANGDSLSQSTPDAASATAGVVIDRSALITAPFVGQSTGSALIGSYGLTLELADLEATDTVFDLTNTARNRPLLVTNTVGGLVVGQDRVLVAHSTGTDTNGDPAIDRTSTADADVAVFTLAAALTTANVTSVQMNKNIPVDTPATGFIRVTDNLGFERKLYYSSYATDTFTIDPTTSEGAPDNLTGVADFDVTNASIGNIAYVAYIDKLATSTAETYQFTYNSDQTHVVIVRDGGVSPIIQFIATLNVRNTAQSVTAIRTADE